MAAGAAVEVCGLVVRFGDTTAVAGASFTVEAGQLVALLGPNGAGKTTTVETCEGYRRPSAGTVRVLGLDPIADRRQVASRVGVMLQRGGVYSTMTAERVLRLFASYYDSPADPGALLDRLDLRRAARTPWRRLSGGEQQRVSLALALVGRPRVAFLDEPTAGVDAAGRRVVRSIVQELKVDGVAVVLTTHDLDEAEHLADHVVILDRGRVAAEGTPAALASRGGAAIRFTAAPGLDLRAIGAAEAEPGEYVVAGGSDAAAMARVAAWLADVEVVVRNLRADGGGLEALFLRLTAADESEQ